MMINYLKYYYKRFRVKMERPDISNLTSIQKKVLKIVTKVITDPESKLYTNPLDKKYYIRKIGSDKINIFITIEMDNKGYRLSIIGKNFITELNVIEKFNYDVVLPDDVGKLVVNKFYKLLKRVRNKMEEEILKENEDNLSDLINNL